MAKPHYNVSALSAIIARIKEDLKSDKEETIDATAWFLGPKAENGKALLDLVKLAVEGQINTRKEYSNSKEDPPFFTLDSNNPKEVKENERSIEIITKELELLLTQLKGSIPLSSFRNQSHMYWDITLPGIVGYFAAMLYNQNNVAAEASPVTTVLEILVGEDLCKMLGFEDECEPGVNRSDSVVSNNHVQIKPWGHITCDGSIANGESMWAARNLKYLPIAMAAAIVAEDNLQAAKCVTVKTCTGSRARLIDLDSWYLLNLPIDEVIGLVARIEEASGVDQSVVRQAVDKYSVQNVGLVQFHQRYLDTYAQAMPVVLVPATAHYSWPKTAAMLGLGTHTVKLIEVDLDGRMNMVALRRELDKCLNKGRPVLQVVAVLGSTEEGAIDPLAEIVSLRNEFQEMGLNFVIHADAAWGGYFASILRKSKLLGADPAVNIDKHPDLYVSDYFKTQYSALPYVDSVTLDPHKSGFIPYPAGSLCYRNGAMRDLIAFTAPVVFHGGVDVTVGPYGIEGSKPGAAAASVYLSHKVIPLNTNGYGRLLGRCLFNSKRFYAALVSMDVDHEKDEYNQSLGFTVTPFQRLPAEKAGATHHEIIEQKKYIKEHIVQHPTDKLISEMNEEQRHLFQSIGSDLSIVAYAFNFKTEDGVNTDLKLMNELNNAIFRALSLQPTETGEIPKPEMFVTASDFDPAVYGNKLTDDFARRAGVVPEKDTPIKFLISTTQNPWLSTTENGVDMIGKLISVLEKTVNMAAKEIINKYEFN